jgi:hypothetical protein
MKQMTAVFKTALLVTVLASVIACSGGHFSDPGTEEGGGTGGTPSVPSIPNTPVTPDTPDTPDTPAGQSIPVLYQNTAWTAQHIYFLNVPGFADWQGKSLKLEFMADTIKLTVGGTVVGTYPVTESGLSGLDGYTACVAEFAAYDPSRLKVFFKDDGSDIMPCIGPDNSIVPTGGWSKQ